VCLYFCTPVTFVAMPPPPFFILFPSPTTARLLSRDQVRRIHDALRNPNPPTSPESFHIARVLFIVTQRHRDIATYSYHDM